MMPKRPRNSSRGRGSSRPSRTRCETAGFTATRMSNEPMNRASVVYNGAIADPKFSTGNTAVRSMHTGAASAFDRTCASEPSTWRRKLASPVARARSISSASARRPSADSFIFPMAASIFSDASPSTEPTDPAESARPEPDARRLSRPPLTMPRKGRPARSARSRSAGFRLAS